MNWNEAKELMTTARDKTKGVALGSVVMEGEEE